MVLLLPSLNRGDREHVVGERRQIPFAWHPVRTVRSQWRLVQAGFLATGCVRSLMLGLTLLALGMSPRESEAQDAIVPIGAVFDKFTGIAVWGSTGRFHDEGSDKLAARYGIEIQLGPFPGRESNPLRDSLKVLARKVEITQIAKARGLPYDPRLSECDKVCVDSLKAKMRAMEVRDDAKSDATSTVTIGVGVDYFDNYKRNVGELEIRFPARGFYVAGYLNFPSHIYFGAVGGFYKILNGTAYDGVTAYDIKEKTTFGMEPVIGYQRSLKGSPLSVFVETGYQLLSFDALGYARVGDGAYPLDAPRRIDLSGFRATFGVLIEPRK
jgi:hypothetical protein